MRSLLSIITSIFLLINSQIVVAQEPSSDWEVILFSEVARQITSITPEGVTLVATLPKLGDELSSPILSSYNSLLLLTASQLNTSSISYLIDLNDLEHCCTDLRAFIDSPYPEDEYYLSYSAGGFNPNNPRQIAVLESSLLRGSEYGPYPPQITKSIYIVDLDQSSTIASVHDILAADLPLVGWSAAGVEFLSPISFGRPGGVSILASRLWAKAWDPLTETIESTETLVVIDQDYDVNIKTGDTLEVTGETIIVDYVTFPENSGSTESLAYFDALRYLAPADNTSLRDQQPQYIHSEYLPGESVYVPYGSSFGSGLRTAFWIADGQAVLLDVNYSRVFDDRTWVLFFRDGTQITMPATGMPLIGTPDGWLAVGIPQDENALIHYQIDTDSRNITQMNLGSVPPLSVQILRRSPLGGSVDAPVFVFPERKLIIPRG